MASIWRVRCSLMAEIVQQLQSRDLLQVKTVYTRVYQEPIPYDQQTVERSDLGFGVVETIQQGVDGTQQLTEEVTYVERQCKLPPR